MLEHYVHDLIKNDYVSVLLPSIGKIYTVIQVHESFLHLQVSGSLPRQKPAIQFYVTENYYTFAE